MQFEWDENKNISNQRKHDLSFEEVVPLFNYPHCTWVDIRKDYGETRYVSIGDLGLKALVLVVYTRRNDTIRIISARIAKLKERKIYNAYIQKEITRNS